MTSTVPYKVSDNTKTITTTLGALVDSALQVLSDQPSLSAVMNWHIARVLQEVVTHLEPYNKAAQDLYKKYGDLSEDKTQYKVRKDELEPFNEEMKALRAQEVTLNAAPIKLEQLEKAQGLTASVLMTLGWLIEE